MPVEAVSARTARAIQVPAVVIHSLSDGHKFPPGAGRQAGGRGWLQSGRILPSN